MENEPKIASKSAEIKIQKAQKLHLSIKVKNGVIMVFEWKYPKWLKTTRGGYFDDCNQQDVLYNRKMKAFISQVQNIIV